MLKLYGGENLFYFYYTVLYSIQTVGVNFAQYLGWMATFLPLSESL